MINANEFLIIECYRKLALQISRHIQRYVLKKYATALCKYQWKTYLSFKDTVKQCDTRCSTIETRTQEEIQRLEEESRLNHDMLPMT